MQRLVVVHQGLLYGYLRKIKIFCLLRCLVSLIFFNYTNFPSQLLYTRAVSIDEKGNLPECFHRRNQIDIKNVE